MKATLQDLRWLLNSIHCCMWPGQWELMCSFFLLLACSSSRILLQQGIWKFKVELDLLLCILLLWSLFFLATTLNSDKFLLFSYSNESVYTKQRSIAVTLEYIYLASHLDFFIIWAVIFVASWIISRVLRHSSRTFSSDNLGYSLKWFPSTSSVLVDVLLLAILILVH